MTRITRFAAVLAVFVGAVTLSNAAPNEHMHGGSMMKNSKMMDRDSTGAMCAVCGMGMMTPRQILVVEDGIIVSVGNKLIKYDKDLNKKKEVTIEIDVEAMKKK